MLRSSEDAEEELTSSSIRDETRDDTHHCPATVIGLCILLWGLKTLTIVTFDNHLGFFGKHILLPILISGYGHCLV